MQATLAPLVACLCLTVNGRTAAPNLVLFVADDLGWDDVGFHGSGQVLTPHLDALASEAVVLDSYYSSPLCTPSRAALLSAVHPIHSSQQNYVIGTSEPRGLPLCLRLWPQFLSPYGYRSHLVGKWHLGFHRRSFTPTARGFDSHFGYWSGEIGYYDHVAIEDGGAWGIDFRQDFQLALNYTNRYTTQLFTERAIEIIRAHDPSEPLFLMVSYQSVHVGHRFARLEAPEPLVRRFSYIRDKRRQVFAAMLLAMDQSIGDIMHALRVKGLLGNSVVAFMSDNGASVDGYEGGYGSNWPLRGSKSSLWEGGIRVPALLWSPFVKPRVSNQLFHVTDWLPTLASAAGIQLPVTHMYGVSQWNSLLDEALPPPRTEVLHNIDPIWNVSAIRVGRFKLVQGIVEPEWQGWFPPPPGAHGRTTFVSTRIRCDPPGNESRGCSPESAACLFDIERDPCERENIAHQQAPLLPSLWRRVQDLASTASPVGRRKRDASSWPPVHGYAWSCWRDAEAEAEGSENES